MQCSLVCNCHVLIWKGGELHTTGNRCTGDLLGSSEYGGGEVSIEQLEGIYTVPYIAPSGRTLNLPEPHPDCDDRLEAGTPNLSAGLAE